MALRAGYFGLKRFEKNKLSVLAASMPGDISPDNPIASKKDISATVDLLKDTTGWTGKNKFPNKTNIVGNNTYTVDSSGYVSTAVDSDGRTWSYANSNIKFTLKKGTYKVRGYEKTASTSGYTGFHILDDNDNELLIVSNWNSFMTDALTLTLAQDKNIGVEYKVGNGEYAFMIATLEQYALNASLEPYHESVELSKYNRSEANILGAKNLLLNKGTSTIADGITWTVNADGTVRANGTKDNNNNGIKILDGNGDNYRLPSGRYVLSGNASSACTLMLQATRNGQLVQLGQVMGSDTETVVDILSTDVLQCVLFVNPEQTVNNVIFYPMLRLATDTEPTYAPYAMTNRELTENVVCKLLTSANDLDDVKEYGNYYWLQSYPTHSPENNMFGALRVLPCGEVVHQMVIRGAASSASIYIRRFQETWSNWFKFTGTEITPPTREEETKKATKKKVIKEEED